MPEPLDPPVPPAASRLAALLYGLCPRCRRGAVFASSLKMNERCPACGLVFARETGYFVGAMYLSYAAGIPLMAALALAVRWFRPSLRLEAILGLAALAFLPLVPLVFRFSRVAWIHFDRAVDRER